MLCAHPVTIATREQGDDPELFVVISSVYPAWTNEWWVGRITPGVGHFDKTAFTPIAGAHGVLDYGGVCEFCR